MFSIFINDLDDGVGSTLTKFAHDTSLGGKVDVYIDFAWLGLGSRELQEWLL